MPADESKPRSWIPSIVRNNVQEYTWWFPPRHDLVYAGYFLIEPGELFRFDRRFPSDEITEAVGKVLPYRRKFHASYKRSCDNCGKNFITYRYLYLHHAQGCNRKAQDVVFYDLEMEERGIDFNWAPPEPRPC